MLTSTKFSASKFFRNNFSNQKGVAGILILLLLVAGVGVGGYLVSQQTNLKPKAAGSGTVQIVDNQGKPLKVTDQSEIKVLIYPPAIEENSLPNELSTRSKERGFEFLSKDNKMPQNTKLSINFAEDPSFTINVKKRNLDDSKQSYTYPYHFSDKSPGKKVLYARFKFGDFILGNATPFPAEVELIAKQNEEGKSSSPRLSLDPRKARFNRGCDYKVQVKVDTGKVNVSGVDAILKYDPTKITAKSISNGSMFVDYPGNSIDSEDGLIKISGLSSPETPITGKGILATLNLSIPKTAPIGNITLDFDFDPSEKGKTIDSNIVEQGTVIDVLSEVSENSYLIGDGSCKINKKPKNIKDGDEEKYN